MPTDYHDYLDSPEWQQQRRRALLRADYTCEQCGARAELDVHHASYRTLGVERPDDLIVLCSTCHREEHAVRNRLLRVREQHGQDRLFDRWPDRGLEAGTTTRAEERRRIARRFVDVMRLVAVVDRTDPTDGHSA